MRGRLAILTGACLALACAAPAGGGLSFPGGGGTSSSVDGGSPDGGTSDGGTPCSPGQDDDGGNGSGLVVSELAFGPGGFVELFDRDPTPLAAADVVVRVGVVDVHPPAALAAGGRVVLAISSLPANGELSVLVDGQVAAYLCWGQVAPSADQNDAVLAGAWQSPGTCPLVPPEGESLHASGTGRFAADYAPGPPSPACE